jgi:chromate transporter
MSVTSQTTLGELARLFLRLGTTSFGGPAAHIAMMEDEVVRRRQWLTREQFLDYVGATNLIPGPNSTELAIHIGHARAGFPGLIVAGACFILPAAILVGVIAWGYVRFGGLPAVAGILYGVKPVVIAVVLQALWGLGRTALKSPFLAALGLFAIIAALLGANEVWLLAAAGLAAALFDWARRKRSSGAAMGFAPFMSPAAVGSFAGIGLSSGAASVVPFSVGGLFAAFVKIGAVLFGSGYVLLAFMRAEFVQRLGWLTEQQLLDAVAVGQVTPGPVFTTATFVGYLVGGSGGAVAATVGIFLPAFVFVAISGPIVPRLRRSPVAAAVLDGVNVASLALMAVVTAQLGRAALVDGLTITLLAVSAVLLLRYRINSSWLVTAGAVIGVIIRR